jgi:hypothetical protein
MFCSKKNCSDMGIVVGAKTGSHSYLRFGFEQHIGEDRIKKRSEMLDTVQPNVWLLLSLLS